MTRTVSESLPRITRPTSVLMSFCPMIFWPTSMLWSAPDIREAVNRRPRWNFLTRSARKSLSLRGLQDTGGR